MRYCTDIGYFATDPKLHEIEKVDGSKTYVCRFRLVFNKSRRHRDENIKEADFFSFVVWDTAAEYIYNNAKKGDQIFVNAEAKTRETDSGTEVFFRVNRFELL